MTTRERRRTAPRVPRFGVGGVLVVALVATLAVLMWGYIATLAWGYVRLQVGGGLTNDSISEPLVGAERAVLELDLGAGHLQLGADGTEQMLSGRVQTLSGIETLTRTARSQDGAMVYRLISHAPPAVREPIRWPEWTLNVNPDVPLKLNVRGGIGASELDLSELSVTDFRLEAETGSYTVTLPERGQVDAVVHGGTGKTTLYLPAGVAFKLVLKSRGAGHIDFGGRSYHWGTTLTSPGYNAATNRLELNVSSTLANVVIEKR